MPERLTKQYASRISRSKRCKLGRMKGLFRIKPVMVAAAVIVAAMAVCRCTPIPEDATLSLSAVKWEIRPEIPIKADGADPVRKQQNEDSDQSLEDESTSYQDRVLILLFTAGGKNSLSQTDIDSLYISAASARSLADDWVLSPQPIKGYIETKKLDRSDERKIVMSLDSLVPLTYAVVITVTPVQDDFQVKGKLISPDSGKAIGRMMSAKSRRVNLGLTVGLVIDELMKPDNLSHTR